MMQIADERYYEKEVHNFDELWQVIWFAKPGYYVKDMVEVFETKEEADAAPDTIMKGIQCYLLKN